jgi:hypothetical protein
MALLTACGLLLISFLQAGYVPSFAEGIFTEKEKKKIEENADDLGERLEVYKDASARLHKKIRKSVADNDYGAVPGQLKIWTSLLSESLKDIETHINPKKKKLKELIKYEIQVRETINDLRDYKLRAPFAQQDIFEEYVDQADGIRSKMVDILFR